MKLKDLRPSLRKGGLEVGILGWHEILNADVVCLICGARNWQKWYKALRYTAFKVGLVEVRMQSQVAFVSRFLPDSELHRGSPGEWRYPYLTCIVSTCLSSWAVKNSSPVVCSSFSWYQAILAAPGLNYTYFGCRLFSAQHTVPSSFCLCSLGGTH